MDLKVTGDIGQKAFPAAVERLRTDENAYVCIFVNFCSETKKWADVLEGKLSEVLLSVDVLQINGNMDKHEKIAFIRLYTSTVKMSNLDPGVLVATAAANTGIDQIQLVHVLRIGLPRCITTMLQERGRNARRIEMQGLFAVFTNRPMFVKLLLSILLPPEVESEEVADHEYINSVITTRSPDTRGKRENKILQGRLCAALMADERHNNIVQGYTDFVDIVHFFSCRTWGASTAAWGGCSSLGD